MLFTLANNSRSCGCCERLFGLSSGQRNSNPVVQNMQLVNSNSVNRSKDSKIILEDIPKVKSGFNLSEHLTENWQYYCIKIFGFFVTEGNPDLRFTNVIEHKIHLKPDAVGKHQKPYRRLPPYKREVLRHHLDNLLRQGIIAPVSETEDLPITSPIVLVTKRSADSDREAPQNFRF